MLDPKSWFSIYRLDRKDGYGGVCIFVCNTIKSSEIVTNNENFNCTELIACQVHFSNIELFFYCVYCAPNVTLDHFRSSMSCIGSSIKISNTSILLGDFNQPTINWDSPDDSLAGKPKELIKLCNEYGLEQINHTATRGENILDLLLTNDPLIISTLDIGPPFESSDHNSLDICIFPPPYDDSPFDAENDINAKVKFDFTRADWPAYENYLESFAWNSVFTECKSSNDLWIAFKNILNKGTHMFVPIKDLPLESFNSKQLKEPRHITNLLLKKNQLWGDLRKNKNDLNKAKYENIVEKIKCARINSQYMYESKIIQSNSLGMMYKHINSRLTHKAGIAPLKGNDGNIILDDESKANVLNKHFVEVGVADDGTLPHLVNSTKTTSELAFIEFDSNSVYTIISDLKSNSSPGPDCIPPSLLKNLSRRISYPLSLLFRLIFQFGTLPDEWKTAIVIPIFKKGNSSDPNNYRPISLTCIISKIFESVIKKQLLSFLNENEIISKHQHGFLSLHSTTTNLLECVNDWTILLDHSAVVKVLYIDFMKAFDLVSVRKLLHKLSFLGINGLLLSCIESFLTCRTQCVRVGTSFSENMPLFSGVPQGSVLGPLLFLIFINDLPGVLEHNCTKLFADDLKSYSVTDYRLDSSKIQTCLDSIVKWSKLWQLQLSVPKCGSILLQTRQIYTDCHSLNIDDVLLPVLSNVKDLGVIIDSRLSFDEHISGIVSRAKQRSYLIFKSFRTRDIFLLICAYKTYILPILDYCSNIWNPYKLGDIDRLEKIQKHFTKRLIGLWTTPYKERLAICGLTSLEHRRLSSDVVLCFKIIHNLIALDFNTFFEYDVNNRTRGHNYKLLVPKWKNQTRHNFFSVRIVPVWNSLPFKIVNCTTVKQFKSCLSTCDLSKFLSR